MSSNITADPVQPANSGWSPDPLAPAIRILPFSNPSSARITATKRKNNKKKKNATKVKEEATLRNGAANHHQSEAAGDADSDAVGPDSFPA